MGPIKVNVETGFRSELHMKSNRFNRPTESERDGTNHCSCKLNRVRVSILVP